MTKGDVDPYKAPQSELAVAGSDEYGDVRVLSFSGRIGRLRYLAYSMGFMFLLSGGVGILAAALAPVINQSSVLASVVASIFMLVVYVVAIVATFTFSVRRLNDMDLSGWLALLFFVPLANFILTIVLWAAPGTKGENRFGLQPPPNSGIVKLLGLAIPAMILLGIVAAVLDPYLQQHNL
jgi:uncharacterized membrane protein YhaH (DUF805 family)